VATFAIGWTVARIFPAAPGHASALRS
jgi:hypothetical protein